MSDNLKRIRFGVMCKGATLSQWEADCLKKLQGVKGVELALVIVDATPRKSEPYYLKLFSKSNYGGLGWSLFNRLYVNRYSKATRPVDMSGEFSKVPSLKCSIIRKGKFSEYFNENDLKTIREYQVDFILRFGFNIIRGEILNVAKYGVWSFHHDDEEKYRGGPPCFWEVYEGDSVTGAILQRLTDRLDGGIILHKGYFKTISHSYAQNKDQVYFGTNDWPVRVCNEILVGRTDQLYAEPTKSQAPIWKRPNNIQMLIFLCKTVKNYLAYRVNRLFRSDWNIGIVDQPIQKFLDKSNQPSIQWLPKNGKETFVADPFGLQNGNTLTILVENFDQLTQKGSISYFEMNGKTSSHLPKPAFEFDVHISYPYLLQHEGEIYCIPETSQAKEVVLLRAQSFPNNWERVGTLIKNSAIVDPTVFFYNNFWWLFCTDEVSGANTKLSAWYASDLFGPWHPHKLNPLKTDVHSSRPGGTPFIYENELYRPAQDCSRSYGGRIVINKVVCLNPDQFEEEIVSYVEPNLQDSYLDGVHTLSAVNEKTLIDAKRRIFLWRVFNNSLKSKLKRFFAHSNSFEHP